MRAGWYKYKLNEVCKIGDGNHSSNYPKANEMVSDGIPFIRANNLVNGEVVWKDMKFISKQKHQILKKGHLKSGDLLFTNRGEIGKIAILGSDFDNSNLNSQIAWFRCLEKIDNRFLFYFLNSPSMKTYYSVEKNGAALQQFTIKQINEIIIPLPPLPEQQRIVAILDECFAALEKAKANAEQNLKNAKELFESYLQGVFENKGEGWEEKPLREVCSDFLQGINTATDKTVFVDEGIPILQAKEIGLNKLDLSNAKFITRDKFELAADRYKPKGGDILYNNIGSSMGRSIIVDWDFDFAIAWNVMRIIPNRAITNPDFLNYILQSPLVYKDIIFKAKGVGMPFISKKDLIEIMVSYPPLLEQQTIVRQLDALRAETQKLEAVYQQKLADLEELKKSILQKAFAGELTAKSIAS